MDQQRLDIETMALAKYFPNRFFFRNLHTDKPYLDLGLLSNSKRVYRAKIEIAGFPFRKPSVYITEPKGLKSFSGTPLYYQGTSHAQHILSSGADALQLCYFSGTWRQSITLYMIGIKIRTWLEAYESHLRTGRNIGSFLK